MSEETITLTPAGKRFWGTKKRELLLNVTDKPVRPYGTYWDGGSKNDYWYVSKNGKTDAVNGLATGISEIPVPNADTAVVEGGFFCGKEKRLRVTVLSKEGWVF